MLRHLAPFAADLWLHRELLWQFTLRNVELRHKGSHLGLVWSILGPLLMLAMYVLVFGYIFNGRFGIVANETRLEYAVGIFIGLALTHLVSEVLGLSTGLIVGNPNFVKKVIFPLEILPAAAVGAALIHLLISLLLAQIAILTGGIGITPALLWLPVILIPVVLIALGLAWLFAALGVFLRDLAQIVQFISMAILWSSGVFFSAEKHPVAWSYLRYNPLLLAIEAARDVLLWHRPVNLSHLAYLYAVSLLVCYGGHATFRRMRPAFADVL